MSIHKLMELLDDNVDNIPEGLYLEICRYLKEIYDNYAEYSDDESDYEQDDRFYLAMHKYNFSCCLRIINFRKISFEAITRDIDGSINLAEIIIKL